MRGGRILWGQIIVVFTIVLVMVWTSTQWVAFRLGFQPQLGNPWFDVAGWPVYYPPAFFWWWFSYDAYAPGIFTEGAFIATSGALFAIAAAFFMSIIRAREARNVATYANSVSSSSDVHSPPRRYGPCLRFTPLSATGVSAVGAAPGARARGLTSSPWAPV